MDFIAVLGGRFEPALNAVLGINSCVKFPPKFKGILASDRAADGATVSRDEFVGHYRDYRNPIAVERGDVHNPEAGTEWLGASLRHDLLVAPGEEVTINCLVGVIDSEDDGKRLVETYLAPNGVSQAFAAIAARAETLVARNAVRTGNEQFDRWMNVWLKQQLFFVARWGRVIGRGFRDILQDVMGHRLVDPARARACILEVFSKQFPSGKCIRAWRLPTAQLDLQDYADSPSWMIMALSMYLKETGDFAVLDEQVAFLNPDDPYAAPTSRATVWEHVVLAQRYLLERRGAHGLTKIYYGDWCDTLNGVGAEGRGESVMLSMQVVWGCTQLAELADRIEAPAVAEEMRAGARELTDAINTHAWDGEWYVRAFDDDGTPVGSAATAPGDNGEGKIFLNAQSWALIAGVASKERSDKAVAAARRYLDAGYGMVLNYPAFTSLRPRIGQMSAMTPGFYENASVYVHGNCFWIYALASDGRADQAWEAMQAILPDTPNKPNTDTEPFTIPNYYIGPNVKRRTQRNLYLSGWRTGSAAWIYMTGLEWLCGIRAEYDGLRIDPRLPEGWTAVTVERSFRGDLYDIHISAAPGGRDTPVRITVDGAPIPGTLVAPFGDGARHEIRVTIG
jgi:cellobiose phosphorylase/cellobionic acid phosphorylase